MTPINEIEEFANYQKQYDKSKSTIASYQNDLIVFARWFVEENSYSFTPCKITPTDIRLYKQYLIDNEFKPNTINRKMLSIKYFVEWGLDTKKIKHRIPFPKLVKENSSTVKWLDRLEQNALLRHFEKYGKVRDVAIVKILLHTGLRVDELCNLKWKHVTINERKGDLIVHYGKGNKSRNIPLNKSARAAFESINYKDNVANNNKVFIGERGALTPRGVQLMLKSILKNTDLSDISPHNLRHSFCKNLINSKVSIEQVAMLAGHEKLDTTRIYCLPSFYDLSKATNRISEEE